MDLHYDVSIPSVSNQLLYIWQQWALPHSYDTNMAKVGFPA